MNFSPFNKLASSNFVSKLSFGQEKIVAPVFSLLRGGRVVAEIEYFNSGHFRRSSRITVVFPPPEGEEITTNSPRCNCNLCHQLQVPIRWVNVSVELVERIT